MHPHSTPFVLGAPCPPGWLSLAGHASQRRVVRRAALLVLALVGVAACQGAADPPMPLPHAPPETSTSTSSLGGAAPLEPPPAESAEADLDAGAPPSAEEEPIGLDELVSIATETSIYTEPRWNSRRLGYLRAGAVIRRSRLPVTAGPKCADGWYRVEPRGFVCVGTLATLDLQHPVALATARRPRLDDLPYRYVLSRSPPPMLYARVPSRSAQNRFEQDLDKHLTKVPGTLPARAETTDARGTAEEDATPDWLLPGRPSLSLGNLWHAPDRTLLGSAKARSGFALLATFPSEGRRFGVTTGLEILALDRVRLVQPSTFAGIALDGDATLPVAFIRRRGGAVRRIPGPNGAGKTAVLAYREAVPITGETRSLDGSDYLVARDGSLLLGSQCIIAKPFRQLPAWAHEGKKWIDVSIPRQTLVAYEGTRPVYATLVSTGVGGTGDPKETHATIQGTFRIYEKHTTVTMDGDESDPFDLRDVPFVQYFHEGFALHGVYWHDDFGRMHSHGCVNLAPRDAAWLFGWTDPRIPPSWHGVMSKAGTIVYVHD